MAESQSRLDVDGSRSAEDRSPKRAKLYTQEEVDRLVQASAGRTSARIPELLREDFTPNDPVHGLLHLPVLVQHFVDTRIFQRMRHINQLAMCSYVYPGATHKRFFHSIGTCQLAYELIKGLQQRQPELGITSRDVLCVTLAALCHDLGHPCYSHMFEEFMHSHGRKLKQTAVRNGVPLSPAEELIASRYERWTHEEASIALLKLLFEELREPMEMAGLKIDEDGDDFACICELIDPPKAALERALEQGELKQCWQRLIRGRPVKKAWMYEIVSNWRSGIDVDKFDYFRRDAYYCGIKRQFNHERYLTTVKVIPDPEGVSTISPPLKDKDTLRDNMLELRKTLHHMAYQHKAVKKLECHMIAILGMVNEHVRITGSGGKRMSLCEAALNVDSVAYLKLTDTFIEGLLLTGEDANLEEACAEYEHRMIKRHLMRLVASWDLPRVGDFAAQAGPMPPPTSAEVISGVLAGYDAAARVVRPDDAVRQVPADELQCQVCAFHYGMKERDPMARVVFHNKSDESKGILQDHDAKPLRHKVFVFWNPPRLRPADEVTLMRLTHSFNEWADARVAEHEAKGSCMPASQASPDLQSPDPLSSGSAVPSSDAPAVGPAAEPKRAVKKRVLKIDASCPPNMDDLQLWRGSRS